MLPQTDGQNRNPENVPNIESPNCHSPACLPACKAVVVAKSDSLGPEVVGAVNNEHVGPETFRTQRGLAIKGEINP
jgi:hypothetical protein